MKFSSFVYTEYLEKYNKEDISLKIVDIGCGNCEDSIFFYDKNNIVFSIDENCNSDNSELIIIKKDPEEVLFSKKLKTVFDVFYIKDFLNTLPYEKSQKILDYYFKSLVLH